MGKKTWQTLSRKTVLESPGMKVVKEDLTLPDGQTVKDYFTLEGNDLVIVIPQTIEGELLMVEHYRHGAKETLLTFPGGGVHAETAEEAAVKHLFGESGYTAQQLTLLSILYAWPARSGQKTYFYWAHGVEQDQSEESQIKQAEVIRIPPEDLMHLVREKQIKDMSTAAAALLFWQMIS